MWPGKPHSGPQWDTCSARELPPGETPRQDTAPWCAPCQLPLPKPPRRSRFRFLLYPRGHFASLAALVEEGGSGTPVLLAGAFCLLTGKPSPHPRGESCHCPHCCYSVNTGTSWQQNAALPLGTGRDPTPGQFPPALGHVPAQYRELAACGYTHPSAPSSSAGAQSRDFPGAFPGSDAPRL